MAAVVETMHALLHDLASLNSPILARRFDVYAKSPSLRQRIGSNECRRKARRSPVLIVQRILDVSLRLFAIGIPADLAGPAAVVHGTAAGLQPLALFCLVHFLDNRPLPSLTLWNLDRCPGAGPMSV